MKKAYYYFFYKIYRSIEYTSEIGGGKFWTDFKTIISIIALEIWLLLSCINYYFVLNNIKEPLNFFNFFILCPFIFILIINYILFIHYDNTWKEYNKEFSTLAKGKNLIGGVIVWGIIILIIINFIFSVHLRRNLVE